MKIRNLKLVWLLLETVGVAALFLPFTSDESPWGELNGFWHWRLGWFWSLALPTCLAPFVWLLTLRSFFPRPLAKPEPWLCAGLVGLFVLVPLGWIAVHSDWRAEGKWIILQWLLYTLAVLAAGVLLTLKRRGVAARFLAPLCLRCAYLPNAVYCLLGFSQWGKSWDQLQVGAACVGATVILYLVEIVHLTRQGLKHRPAVAP